MHFPYQSLFSHLPTNPLYLQSTLNLHNVLVVITTGHELITLILVINHQMDCTQVVINQALAVIKSLFVDG
jgi:hypothetical protein